MGLILFVLYIFIFCTTVQSEKWSISLKKIYSYGDLIEVYRNQSVNKEVVNIQETINDKHFWKIKSLFSDAVTGIPYQKYVGELCTDGSDLETEEIRDLLWETLGITNKKCPIKWGIHELKFHFNGRDPLESGRLDGEYPSKDLELEVQMESENRRKILKAIYYLKQIEDDE